MLEARRRSLLARGGDGAGVLLSPVALPPPRESRLVNRLKPSGNVRDSEPEVGSASAGQTSFAGWRGRGRGSSGGGTSETPGCWERPGEGGGRGPRVGSGAARGREPLPPRGWGSGGLRVLCPRPAAAQPPPAAPAAPANCSGGAPCSLRGPPARPCPPSGFPNSAAFQPEPIPSGEPLSHLFSSLGVGFFLFFFSPFGSEVLESHLESSAWLSFPLPLRPLGGGEDWWGGGGREDAEDKLRTSREP